MATHSRTRLGVVAVLAAAGAALTGCGGGGGSTAAPPPAPVPSSVAAAATAAPESGTPSASAVAGGRPGTSLSSAAAAGAGAAAPAGGSSGSRGGDTASSGGAQGLTGSGASGFPPLAPVPASLQFVNQPGGFSTWTSPLDSRIGPQGSGYAYTSRRAIVVESYRRLFGRNPKAEELGYWMPQPARDPRLATLSAFNSNNAAYLRSSPAEASATASRAALRVFGVQVLGESNHYDVVQRLTARASSGAGFDTIVSELTNDYLAQARDKLSRGRGPRTDSTLDTRVRALVDSGTSGADVIWGMVAQASGNDVWAPYRAARGAVGVEQCAGAIGPKCPAAINFGPLKVAAPVAHDSFTRLDGMRFLYYTKDVAVGSVVHDSACYRATALEGVDPAVTQWCGGKERGDQARAGLEWRKAVYNQRDGRSWNFEWFGPYPESSSLRDQFADDVRMVPNRPARLASTNGPRGLDTDYSAGELKQASVLFAQRGRPLDSTDAAFCAAGRFSGTYRAFGVGDWGICA